VLTPSGRLLRRSAHAGDRPALFAAQFALSHACWLLTYPLAGSLGATIGLGPTCLVLAVLAVVGLVAAAALWPRHDPEEIEHDHAGLPAEHPHRANDHRPVPTGPDSLRHRHAFVIDELHPKWPR
jgi:hypothetical protein